MTPAHLSRDTRIATGKAVECPECDCNPNCSNCGGEGSLMDDEDYAGSVADAVADTRMEGMVRKIGRSPLRGSGQRRFAVEPVPVSSTAATPNARN